jgi:thiol-disulfide isomerase/thioredoxin
MFRVRPCRAGNISGLSASLLVVLAVAWSADRALRPAAAAEPARSSGNATIPEVPDGTPEELLSYIDGLKKQNMRPTSRQQMMEYMRKVAAASVEAADKILAQVQPADAAYEKASGVKLESLMMLGRLGDEQAAAALPAYAETLAQGPSQALAMEAKRILIVAKAQQVLGSGDVAAGPGLIAQTKELFLADPTDQNSAGLAMQLAGAFEQMPGGEGLSVEAYKTFGPLFAASSSEAVRQMGESFAGTLRRLSLPGNPMVVKGTHLDGRPFDPAALTGKVVLVDFWATWCGPCVAEIPNVREQYEKYHARGFEVIGISLDQDREALVKFVKDQKIPWPILFEQSTGADWQHPLATYYGISGIPTVILIGRDGKVIDLNARGERLGQQLDRIFKDAG